MEVHVFKAMLNSLQSEAMHNIIHGSLLHIMNVIFWWTV